MENISGFYVSFNFFTFQDESGYFTSEIRSSEAERAQTELGHCQCCCSVHCERFFPHPSHVCSQVLGNDPEHLINEKECAPCCDRALY